MRKSPALRHGIKLVCQPDRGAPAQLASVLIAHAVGAAHMPVLGRQALVALAEDEKWPTGWVFDGRKNMYSPLELDSVQGRRNTLSQEEQEFKVRSKLAWQLLQAQR